MEAEKKLLKKSSLEALTDRLVKAGKEVYAPVRKKNVVDFEKISSISEMDNDYVSTNQSAKSFVFPKNEKILDYKKTRTDVIVNTPDLNSYPEVVAIGTRPCDAAGFTSLTAIFKWDGLVDEIYDARLKKLTLISISCKKADDFCFCTSVNGGPGNTAGSDILLTEMTNGDFIAEVLTEKGKAIADANSDLFEKGGDADKNSFLAKVEQVFNHEEITSKIRTMFESEIWEEQAMRCLGCGACAFVCPACGCFDIQDDVDGKCGNRVRCWDSCGFKLFTLHTSGHNPRETQGERWRQRVFHKFSYQPERQMVYGCVGCGRCSRGCPVDMNIKEHLVELKHV